MTNRAYESSRSDLPKRRNPTPQRSRVAPVNRRESGDDASGNMKKLLAGIDPKVASEALAKANILGTLPAAEQTALRCSLLAASESLKKGELIQVELSEAKKQFQRAEKGLLAESEAFRSQSARAEAQVADLKNDLAEAMATNRAFESRFRMRRVYFWLALGAAMSALFLCVSLIPRPARSPERPLAAESRLVLPQAGEPVAWQPEVRRGGVSVVAQAFDRLEGTLAAVPVLDLGGVLREANRWLVLSGIPPCTVELAEGQTSLLIGGKGREGRSLTQALVRCSRAVEHVTQ